MPININHVCQCGRKYYLYMPFKMYAKEAGYSPKGIAVAEKIDKEDHTPERMEIQKKIAELYGAEFKDLSVNEIVQCECGKVLDMLAVFAKARDAK